MFGIARTVMVGMLISSIALLMASGTVRSEARNPVSVQISSICRYHIERMGLVPRIDSKDTVETVNVSILSNSDRPWQLMVSCKNNPLRIEWSANGIIWQELSSQPVIVLTGYRSFWNNYRLFYRYQDVASVRYARFQYQVLFID